MYIYITTFAEYLVRAPQEGGHKAKEKGQSKNKLKLFMPIYYSLSLLIVIDCHTFSLRSRLIQLI